MALVESEQYGLTSFHQLYGRQPRLKTPQQITAELDAMCSQKGHPASVYFVDDNFIGNRKAAREMLPHLVQ